MKQSVSLQLIQLLASLGAGAVLGIIYDALRALRRETKTDAVFDAVFWITALPLLFGLGMGIGKGSLKLSMMIFAALGFGVYMLTVSRLVFGILNTVTHCIAKILHIALKPLKKIIKFSHKLAKSIFSKVCNRFTIVRNSRKKLRGDETEKLKEDNADNYSGAGHIRYGEPSACKKRPS